MSSELDADMGADSGWAEGLVGCLRPHRLNLLEGVLLTEDDGWLCSSSTGVFGVGSAGTANTAPVLRLARSFSFTFPPLSAEADERRLTRWRQSPLDEEEDCEEANEKRSMDEVRLVTGFLAPDGRTVELEGVRAGSNETGIDETLAGEEVERIEVDAEMAGNVGGTSIGGLSGRSARGCRGITIDGVGLGGDATNGGLGTRVGNASSPSWSMSGVGGIGSSLGGDGGGGVLDADGYPCPNDICDVRLANVFCADLSDGLEGSGLA